MTKENRLPAGPTNLKGWLFLLAIYAVAGAVLGGPARGPVSPEDSDWRKWAGLLLYWAVLGGVIGATVHWLKRQFVGYGRAIASFAVIMPAFMILVEGLRLLAAWYWGGWEAGIASAGIGALIGVAVCPLMTILFVAVRSVLGLVLPSAGRGTEQAAGPTS